MSRRHILLAVVAIFLFAAAPAVAKVPTFSVEVEPQAPVPGEPITVTVELTQPIPVENLTGLVAFFRPEDVESRFNGRPIPLERVGEATYRGEVVLRDSGAWMIVAFPDRTGSSTEELAEGYPDPILVQVEDGVADSPVVVVASIVVVGVAATLIGWRFMFSAREA